MTYAERIAELQNKLQTLIGEVQGEVDNYEPEDPEEGEDETESPFAEALGELNTAETALSDALSNLPTA